MTDEQARDILTHFTKEMESNGYGEILSQIRIGEEALYENNNNERRRYYSDRERLRYYVTEAMSILNNRSSAHLPGIITKLNNNIEATEPITGFRVQLIDDTFYDLADLPNYDALITGLHSIYQEIDNE